MKITVKRGSQVLWSPESDEWWTVLEIEAMFDSVRSGVRVILRTMNDRNEQFQQLLQNVVDVREPVSKPGRCVVCKGSYASFFNGRWVHKRCERRDAAAPTSEALDRLLASVFNDDQGQADA